MFGVAELTHVNGIAKVFEFVKGAITLPISVNDPTIFKTAFLDSSVVLVDTVSVFVLATSVTV